MLLYQKDGLVVRVQYQFYCSASASEIIRSFLFRAPRSEVGKLTMSMYRSTRSRVEIFALAITGCVLSLEIQFWPEVPHASSTSGVRLRPLR